MSGIRDHELHDVVILNALSRQITEAENNSSVAQEWWLCMGQETIANRYRVSSEGHQNVLPDRHCAQLSKEAT